MSSKAIVLDANILIRAVLGRRVRGILRKYKSTAQLFAPDVAVEDARTHLPALLKKSGSDVGAGMLLLDHLERRVEILRIDAYGRFRKQALLRIGARDPEDWPVIACAMALGCPIWTEDADFFGVGISIWTTDRIELYYSE
jgi:predicted nucleic acid-binding protein